MGSTIFADAVGKWKTSFSCLQRTHSWCKEEVGMNARVCPIKERGHCERGGARWGNAEKAALLLRSRFPFQIKTDTFRSVSEEGTNGCVHLFGDRENWKRQKSKKTYCYIRVAVHAYIRTCGFFVHVCLCYFFVKKWRETMGTWWLSPQRNPLCVRLHALVCVCVCACVCVFLFCSGPVLSHRWAGYADRNRVLGGPATGAPRGTRWACSEKYRKGISLLWQDGTRNFSDATFHVAKFFSLIDVCVTFCAYFLLLHSRWRHLPRIILILLLFWTCLDPATPSLSL